MSARIRVGIVGVQAGDAASWAARAHVPALRWMPEIFEVRGIANRSEASAVAAAGAFDIPRAFKNVQELVESPDIDIVVISVRVPHHLALVKSALEAGKHVFCEWPLGNGLAEARELAALARKAGRLAVVGTQARVSPAIRYVKQLIAEGFIGNVMSSTIVGRGSSWGATHNYSQLRGYLLDPRNGATMLTIPMGHTLAAMQDVLGDVADVSAMIANVRKTLLAKDTGEIVPMSAPDQAILNGHMVSGALFSMHYRGGSRPGVPGFIWEIYGSDGELRITGSTGHTQMVELTVEGAQRDGSAMTVMPLPAHLVREWPDEIGPANVARLYARMAHDLGQGTRTAPDFEDAVGLHTLIDAIEVASKTGERVRPGVQNRELDSFATLRSRIGM